MLLPSGYSTTNYSVRADAKGWGRGWTPTQTACAAEHDLQVVLTRNKARLPMRTAIAELVDILIEEVERRGYLAVNGWCWGYSCRNIAGGNNPSNHSWGLAFDLNAPRNPYTSSGQHDIPDWVFAIFRAYGFGVGADYSGSKKDWMHFEFMGTPRDAELMTALARRAFRPGGGTTPPATDTPAPPSDGGWPLPAGQFFGPSNAYPSNNGTDNQAEKNYVAEFQNKLRELGYDIGPDGPDGHFGENTQRATHAWQQRVGATVGPGPRNIIDSGLCGSNDWYGIHEALYQVRAVSGRAYPGAALRKGDSNDDVLWVQQRLAATVGLDYSSAPGLFGPRTETAVETFQRQRGLGVDGVVGRQTWSALGGAV